MTDARLEEILRIMDSSGGLPPDDMTDEETRYCLDKGLVTVLPTGITMTQAHSVTPGQAPDSQDLPKYQPIGGLTAKGKQKLKDLQHLFGYGT